MQLSLWSNDKHLKNQISRFFLKYFINLSESILNISRNRWIRIIRSLPVCLHCCSCCTPLTPTLLVRNNQNLNKTEESIISDTFHMINKYVDEMMMKLSDEDDSITGTIFCLLLDTIMLHILLGQHWLRTRVRSCLRMLLTMTRIKVVSGLMISDGLGSGTVEVGWVGLSWEWILVWECMRIRIDQPEHSWSASSESSHVKHHHVHQKLSHSRTRSTEWSTCVLPLTTSWISSKT